MSSQSIAVEPHFSNAEIKQWIKHQKEENKQITCLAENIFFEARNTDRYEMKKVANVTMNRLKSPKYPKTICEIVHQHKQFSWTTNFNNNIQRITRLIRKNIFEDSAWKSAKSIAYLTVHGYVQDETHGAIFYHTNYVHKPHSWGKVTLVLKTKYDSFYIL
jgi:spore germination cell wall hydrolase CwlJ-like protein